MHAKRAALLPGSLPYPFSNAPESALMVWVVSSKVRGLGKEGGDGFGEMCLLLVFLPQKQSFHLYDPDFIINIMIFFPPLKVLVGLRVLFSQQTVCGDLLLNNNGKRISI